MNFSESYYVGKKIELFPGDSVKRTARIVSVDDLGWTIEILTSTTVNYVVGQKYFFSHSLPFTFKFINY